MAFELFMSCVLFWFQKGKVLKFKIIETVCILLKGYGYHSVQTATIHGHVLVVPVHQYGASNWAVPLFTIILHVHVAMLFLFSENKACCVYSQQHLCIHVHV